MENVLETINQLSPAYTRFDKRILYVSHDITDYLLTGNNGIDVILGNGWYNHQSLAVWNYENAPWRNRPTFAMSIRLSYENGTSETIKTDDTWKTNAGPLV